MHPIEAERRVQDFQMKDAGYLRRENLAGRLMTSSETLGELFKYHSPTPETLPKYAAINQARGFSKAFYQKLDQRCTGMEFAIEMIVKSCLRGAAGEWYEGTTSLANARAIRLPPN